VKKKRARRKKAHGPRPSLSQADDGVAFLETFHNVITCMTHSLPMLQKLKIDNLQNINFGKLFYPYFKRLIINFTELAPILLRNYNI